MPRESGVVRIVRPGRKPFYRCQIKKVPYHLGTDRQEAYRKFAKLIGPRAPVARPETVAEAIAGYLRDKTGHWAEPFLKHWGIFAGHGELDALKPDCLERFARDLTGKTYTVKKRNGTVRHETYSAKTVNGAVRCAMAVLRWCHDRQFVSAIPRLPRLPRSARMPRDIDPRRLKRLMKKLPDPADNKRARATPLIRFIVFTGCRPKEARLLRWEDVHLESGICTIRTHKTARRTGKVRTLYLTPDAKAIVASQSKKGEYVFPSGRGKPYTAGGLRSFMRRRGENSVYALRHTFAQAALEAGTPSDIVAKLLGHSDLQTVQVYAQVRDPQAMEAARRLGGLHGPSPVPQRSGSKPKLIKARRARA